MNNILEQKIEYNEDIIFSIMYKMNTQEVKDVFDYEVKRLEKRYNIIVVDYHFQYVVENDNNRFYLFLDYYELVEK